ncbi:MAG: hypothetical protein NZO16_02965 [Deltaproteobacteria bacterium]|nr:hypothetical protein [Deltaproteobacteria bacterium]
MILMKPTINLFFLVVLGFTTFLGLKNEFIQTISSERKPNLLDSMISKLVLNKRQLQCFTLYKKLHSKEEYREALEELKKSRPLKPKVLKSKKEINANLQKAKFDLARLLGIESNFISDEIQSTGILRELPVVEILKGREINNLNDLRTALRLYANQTAPIFVEPEDKIQTYLASIRQILKFTGHSEENYDSLGENLATARNEIVSCILQVP